MGDGLMDATSGTWTVDEAMCSAVDPCDAYADCGTCAAVVGCGWCEGSGACVGDGLMDAACGTWTVDEAMCI